MSSPQVVTGWNTKDWNKDDGTTVKVTNVRFGTGEEIPGYDIPVDLLKENAPLPEGWTIAESKAGKPYIKVPKKGGGKGGFEAAFRNTAGGQAYEQERMDRRTALMQAVTFWPAENAVISTLEVADRFYEWLRASVPAGVSASQPATSPHAGASSSAPAPIAGTTAESKWAQAIAANPPVAEADGGEGVATTGEGASSPSDCPHLDLSPLTPGGKPLKTGMRCLACGLVVPS